MLANSECCLQCYHTNKQLTVSSTLHVCEKWFTNRQWSMAYLLINTCAGNKVIAKDFIKQISAGKDLYI